MVGNDVVDLRDESAASERAPRFDARVFCEAELRALDEAPHRARLRWQLWAAKEAAYKVAVKHDPSTVFSPSRFRVRLIEARVEARVEAKGRVVRGRVETPAGELPVEMTRSGGAVHGVVIGAGGERSHRVIRGMTRLAKTRLDPRDPEAPGREARRFATRRIARALGADPSSLEIRKRGRVPELWVDGRPSADLSLSHHGGVVGFACSLGTLPGRLT